MKKSEFLRWISARLVNVYGESPNVDFVIKLNEIANTFSKVESGEILMLESEMKNLTGSKLIR